MATFRNTATGGENAIEGVASTGRGIVGFSKKNYGVSGDSQSFAGVRGTSGFSRGVEGWSKESEGVFGITGFEVGGGGVAGVWGLSNQEFSPGVVGTVSSDVAPGVAGTNDLKGPGVAGASAGPGVIGESRDAFGVVGQSKGFGNGDGRGRGGVDGTTFHGGAGVRGSSYGAESKGGVGVEAYSEGGTALVAIGQRAALFAGDVLLAGILHANDVDVADLVASNIVAHRLTVTGTKSAAVPHPDGMHPRLYCMESPECWFEDFGEASLQNGVARVKLEREFASIVKTGRYHVFLSSYDSVQLYVSKRSREGFEIRALPDARGKLRQRARCAYRIVARRKDVKAPRLAKVKIPVKGKRPPFPKLLKSPVRLSKRTHNQLAGLRKAHRKRLREVKRFTATAAKRDHK